QPGLGTWDLEFRDGVVMDGALAEHAKEAIPVLSSYVDVLAIRSFAGLVDRAADREDRVLSSVRAMSRVPVLNLESARWHPLQGLADQATWTRRLGDPRGKRIVLTWAPHPKALPQAVPNQVLLSAAMLGMDVVVAHPEGFDLEPDVIDRASTLASEAGGGVRVTHDLASRFEGAQVVYAKSWSGSSSYGRREAEASLRAASSAWQVTDVPTGAGFMHCLPVRRNVVVSDAVLDGPSSWVQEQAAFRLWTVLAVLEAQLGGVRWPSA
ncbi:MAG: N-acetylornithine carbamoyltransferase, partial [Myxococcales bacterium]|nr:N-acetylornithine carbamoyltransferase [Myxococcales bacterium]